MPWHSHCAAHSLGGLAVDARKSVCACASIICDLGHTIRRGNPLQIWRRTEDAAAKYAERSNHGLLHYRQRAGGSMLAGSVMVAGVAVFGCFMMATMASVSAQQIGNSQGQPSNAPPTPGTGKPTRANPAPLVIACSGAFARDSHHLKLTMTYHRKNVDFGEVDAGPGKSMASIIYPNDPKRRLEVWWSDVDKRKDVYLIAINGSSTWTGPGGLRLGLSLADLEKLNHKPFKLRGIDKDKTATVSDWDHGALAALSGGCKAGVILSAEAKAAAQVLAVLPVDREFSSADEALRAVRPSVTEILIGY